MKAIRIRWIDFLLSIADARISATEKGIVRCRSKIADKRESVQRLHERVINLKHQKRSI